MPLLDRLNNLTIPPYPRRAYCIGEKGEEKVVRLKIYLEMLRELDPARNAEEALSYIQECMEHVENLYSGHINDPENMEMGATPRMYPALDRYITRRQDGSILVRTKGNRIEIDSNGSYIIYDKDKTEIWLRK